MADTDDVDRSRTDSSGGPTPAKGVNPTTDAASAETVQDQGAGQPKSHAKEHPKEHGEEAAKEHGEGQGAGKGKTARKGRPTRKQRRAERGGQHDSIAKAPPPDPEPGKAPRISDTGLFVIILLVVFCALFAPFGW